MAGRRDPQRVRAVIAARVAVTVFTQDVDVAFPPLLVIVVLAVVALLVVLIAFSIRAERRRMAALRAWASAHGWRTVDRPRAEWTSRMPGPLGDERFDSQWRVNAPDPARVRRYIGPVLAQEHIAGRVPRPPDPGRAAARALRPDHRPRKRSAFVVSSLVRCSSVRNDDFRTTWPAGRSPSGYG